MPRKLSMMIENPQATLARQQALHIYTIQQQQQNKLAALKNGGGNGFQQSMISRIHNASKSCGACGH